MVECLPTFKRLSKMSLRKRNYGFVLRVGATCASYIKDKIYLVGKNGKIYSELKNYDVPFLGNTNSWVLFSSRLNAMNYRDIVLKEELSKKSHNDLSTSSNWFSNAARAKEKSKRFLEMYGSPCVVSGSSTGRFKPFKHFVAYGGRTGRYLHSAIDNVDFGAVEKRVMEAIVENKHLATSSTVELNIKPFDKEAISKLLKTLNEELDNSDFNLIDTESRFGCTPFNKIYSDDIGINTPISKSLIDNLRAYKPIRSPVYDRLEATYLSNEAILKQTEKNKMLRIKENATLLNDFDADKLTVEDFLTLISKEKSDIKTLEFDNAKVNSKVLEKRIKEHESNIVKITAILDKVHGE